MARILIGKNIFCYRGTPEPRPFPEAYADTPYNPSLPLARFLLSGEHDSPFFTHHLLPSSQGSETDTFPSDVGPVPAKLVKDVWVKDVPGLEIPSLGSLASMLEDHVESAKCREISEFRVPTEYTGKNIGARK